MIEVIGSAACVALVTVLAYVERKSLKADVTAAEAKVLTVAGKLIAELQLKEKSVRAKVSADVAKVIAGYRTDVKALDAKVGAVCIDQLEADLKKVL